MSERIVVYCDRCEERASVNSSGRFEVVVDRKMDGAGSVDDITELIDLCPRCMAACLQEFVDLESLCERVAWLKRNKV